MPLNKIVFWHSKNAARLKASENVTAAKLLVIFFHTAKIEQIALGGIATYFKEILSIVRLQVFLQELPSLIFLLQKSCKMSDSEKIAHREVPCA